MPHDKQLLSLRLDDVLEKRRLDQALNAKEFAVLVGISYSAARGWFRLPGFPVFQGVVFWEDFVQWRRTQTSCGEPNSNDSQEANAKPCRLNGTSQTGLPPRALKLLAQAS